jgi:diguanylate cyclase (GGDEF)-like protein/PAS domain S-box-containing protein
MSRAQPLHTIGLLIPYLGGIFCGNIIMSAYEAAQRRGARLLVIQESPRRVAQSRLAWEHVDGWIVTLETDGVELLTEAGAVVVTISDTVPGVPAVLPDNYAGISAAMSHLIGHGHRRIAFIGRLGNADVAQRLEGYQQALAAHGLPFDERLVITADNELEQGARHAAQTLLASGVDFTAIVASTDLNALGVFEALREAGRRIPEDCAVVGFDDIPMAQTTSPPLTTVRQHFPQLAHLAVERLLAQLADPSLPPDILYTKTLLITRRSCGCSVAQEPGPLGRQSTPDAAIWRETLSQQLLKRLVSLQLGETPAARYQLWSALGTLLDAVEQAFTEQALPDTVTLEAAWYDIIVLGSDVLMLNDVCSTIERLSAQRLGATPIDDPAAVRIAETLRVLRNALLMARVTHEHSQIDYLDRMLYTNNEVSIAMFDTWSTSAPTLDWLQHTPAVWGCLGLWSDPATQTELSLASSYISQELPPESLGEPVAPAAFPPIKLLARDATPKADLITLVPLRTARRAWGVLAINAVINTSVTWYSDPVAMWARTLSAALERAALLKHRAQQEGLLENYQREQVLTATLRASEERYALAAAATNDGLWDWDLPSGSVYYSPRWKALLGYDEPLVGTSIDDWFGRVHPDDLPFLQDVIAQHHASRSSHFETELRMLHFEGHFRWMLCRGTTVYDLAGAPLRLAGSISDISQRRRFEEQLRHSALHDALTGLPNRSFLLDRLERAIQRARRSPRHLFALLFLDLDRFKTINDSLGHQVGDLLLINIGQRLQALVSPGDTVARLGGDEFVILLESIAGEADATATVGRIEQALRAPFTLGGHELFASASIGILVGSGHYERPEDLLRDADMAMYRAKALGGGRHEAFSEPLHIEARARLQLETDLHRALERREFALFYQPIVSLESRQVIGAEALLRWQHPLRGLVAPQEFIPLAEETGLIEPLGRWVLREACTQAREWHRRGHTQLSISVNVSVRELQSPGFAEAVKATLEESGLAAGQLIIEMTESAYMEHVTLTSAVVERLRELGVQIAFDDFGTGYSSLSYLRHFRVNRIKIDRSFIHDLTGDTDDMAITGAMIAMAHQLNIAVVAEGVETEEQLELLRGYGCDTAQGYLISRPVPNDTFLALLRVPHSAAVPATSNSTAVQAA